VRKGPEERDAFPFDRRHCAGRAITMDLQGIVVVFNQRAEKLFSLPASAILGRPAWNSDVSIHGLDVIVSNLAHLITSTLALTVLRSDAHPASLLDALLLGEFLRNPGEELRLGHQSYNRIAAPFKT